MGEAAMDLSSVLASPSSGKAGETYNKAVAAAASAAAYTVLARTMARELLPDELRDVLRWGAAVVRDRVLPRRRQRRTKTVLINRAGEQWSHGENRLYRDALAYLATRINPRAVDRLCLAVDLSARPLLTMVPGDSMKDAFEGVEFTWTLCPRAARRRGDDDDDDGGGTRASSLSLSFDAEHMGVALGRYIPFILASVAAARRRDRALQIYVNAGSSWRGISHHHPATFDTVAMDPALKQSIIADLDRFLKRRDYYRRIGKAWKRGYLLYGPPGTGKSSLVAAMANHLRFNIYDLDLSEVPSNRGLQKLLTEMSNKSILLVEDIDCCFSTRSREGVTEHLPISDGDPDSDSDSDASSYCYTQGQGITLSGLLNFVDGLWSTTGEQRILVFTTNYKDRLDPALLRPGRMDMHIHMGYCGWEAFKTLAKNYHLVDDHALFPEIQELLAEVEVTAAEVTEMLLRSEDAAVALQGFVEFLQAKKKRGNLQEK
ncbi:hypothetical protein ACP70R_005731 [Stipagrostis hirtigluma subsp. patula]